MKGLITHEESQVVTTAFRNQGHEFYSNDLQDCSGSIPEYHLKGDCFEVFKSFDRLDFLGCHPTCTYLANSGVSWLASRSYKSGFTWSSIFNIYINDERFEKMIDAANHFVKCLEHLKRVGRGYIENPIMHKYAMNIVKQKQTQVIQPYMFGHKEQKATCLWLVNLPPLEPTNDVKFETMNLPDNERQRLHYLPKSNERAKLRSKTYPGIALAMSKQWS